MDDLEERYVKYPQNRKRIVDGGDDRRGRGKTQKRAKTKKKIMTNGRTQADTSEKTIKDGTSKDGGGGKKDRNPEGRTNMGNERWESIGGGRGRQNWRFWEEKGRRERTEMEG